MESLKDFWERRYSQEENMWGLKPHQTAHKALELFKKYEAKSILVPGSGYGRNSKLFSENGFKVEGIEISSKAHAQAKDFDKKTTHFLGSILDIPFSTTRFDGVYCLNTLHLLSASERKTFLSKLDIQLNKNAIVFFVLFSENDPKFGCGKKIDDNTFETKTRRPVHFFTEDDLVKHFENYTILETDMIQEEHSHGERGLHTHGLRYIIGQKKGDN